ncbi:Bpu10I family restriction endonuclease [Flavobacterium restrictum]|uniref:Bpu10I family restriction endonuclease n=1 Tax=Flavobacterium restrictum TaxID=2594428 RepID=A0A553DV67_9FLAO|nr:Bpu10I family restriction endonuclease [Flavobacterium restrictum]TRX36684.1 Bpu10I family restriction endonuclease [Flavobacterium restrictum]
MTREKIIEFLKSLDPKKLIHASNFLAKLKVYDSSSSEQKKAFDDLLPIYYNYLQENLKLKGFSNEIIEQRTVLLNNYYSFIFENNYDNIFKSQSKFRPTIIEEFLYLLFNDLIEELKIKNKDEKDVLKVGTIKAYSNLYFTAKNLNNFINGPSVGINTKDQDFAIYRPLNLSIQDIGTYSTNIPVVSIECKTYIDKTMLEGSIATAEKIKSGNPYSLFIIITETYEVDLKVDPVYSRINQIYVLRKTKRKDANQPIYTDVLIDLVNLIKNHLERDWSDIQNKLSNHGKII